MNVEEVAGVLEGAADLIQSVGHAKGVMSALNDHGDVVGYCVVGALLEAARGEIQLYDQAAKVLRAYGGSLAFITLWNDAPERTSEEVVDALKTTAKDLRNQA